MSSSTIHCASLCTTTQRCSAYQFNVKSGGCSLGSKFNLLMSQPSDSQGQITNITINTDGKNIFKKIKFIDILTWIQNKIVNFYLIRP